MARAQDEMETIRRTLKDAAGWMIDECQNMADANRLANIARALLENANPLQIARMMAVVNSPSEED